MTSCINWIKETVYKYMSIDEQSFPLVNNNRNPRYYGDLNPPESDRIDILVEEQPTIIKIIDSSSDIYYDARCPDSV